MEHKKLRIKKDYYIYQGEKYICSISMTDLHMQYVNDEHREEGESWLDYRNRVKPLMEIEERKRNQLAFEMVNAYNEKFNL